MYSDNQLSVSEIDGKLLVDSRLIAAELGLDHNDWLNNVILPYQVQTEQAFGIVRFENVKTGKPGRPQRFALLTEDQATFLMTLSRNSPEVIECKIKLVVAFSRAKDLLARKEPKPAQIPYWYQRLQIAMSDMEKPLQAGYFCVYQEIMSFFAEMEIRFGYIVKDYDDQTGRYLVPDISIGQGFNKFLRNDSELAALARSKFLSSDAAIDFREGRSHFHEILQYNHVYPKISHGDFQVQPARSYPNKYIEIFRYYLQEYWIPDRCARYLGERDPLGIEKIKNQVAAMSIAERNALSATLVGKLIYSLLSLPPQS